MLIAERCKERLQRGRTKRTLALVLIMQPEAALELPEAANVAASLAWSRCVLRH